MIAIPSNSFEQWRQAARALLLLKVHPSNTAWLTPSQKPLFQTLDELLQQNPLPQSNDIKVPKDFLPLAERAAAHTHPLRWQTLYSILWRLTLGNEPNLLLAAADPDVRNANLWAKAVGREIHKMHAFVRFRSIGINPDSGREQFIAWFEPEFHIVRLASPFFVRRFASMDWSILTPIECAHWNGSELTFTEGASRNSIPPPDASEDAWRVYYRNIFNPTRTNSRAMLNQMPQKYWKNLPEAQEIPHLLLNPNSNPIPTKPKKNPNSNP